MTFQNHPSFSAVWNAVSGKTFSFSSVLVADIAKEIKILGIRKTIQNTDILIKMLKVNADIFGEYICLFFKKCVVAGTFSDIKNTLILHLFLKMGSEAVKATTSQ